MDPKWKTESFIQHYKWIMEDVTAENARHKKALEGLKATYRDGMDGGRIDAECARHDSAMASFNAQALQMAREVRDAFQSWEVSEAAKPIPADLAATLQTMAAREKVGQFDIDVMARACAGNYQAMVALADIAASKGLEHPVRAGSDPTRRKNAPTVESVERALKGFMRSCGDGLEKSTSDKTGAPLVIAGYGKAGEKYLEQLALEDKLVMAEALLREYERFEYFYSKDANIGEADPLETHDGLSYKSPNDGQTVGLGHTVGLF